MTTKQTEALQIIQHMDDKYPEEWHGQRIRAELRRLDEANKELLEALQRVCSHGKRTSQHINDDWDFARAAIAKHKGE